MTNIISQFTKNVKGHINEAFHPQDYSEWLRDNTTLYDLPFTTKKYPFQTKILNDMHTNMSVIKCSQVGLPLALDTPVFTVQGWKNLGDIKVGDFVYAPDGTAVEVVYLSPIQTDSPCYELTFCDGTKITADENHRWFVHSERAFNLNGLYAGRGRIPVDSDFATKGRITTKGIFENYQQSGRNIFYVPCTQPIQTHGFACPVDPYWLGLWLGNGGRRTGNLTINEKYLPETLEALTAKGFSVNVYTEKNRLSNCRQLTVKQNGINLSNSLQGFINTEQQKYFPSELLLCSIEQRLELLQGLIDSDGNISKLGRVEFYNTSLQLVKGFFELAASLGFKPRIRFRATSGKTAALKNGRVITSRKDVYACHFMAYGNSVLSKLSAKQKNLKLSGRKTESFQRRIVNVQPVAPVPVRCIMVDHPDHQFVCSKAFITTSNTEIQIRKALAVAVRNPHRTVIFSLPDDDMRKRLYQTRVQKILTQDEVFQATKDDVRSIEITQFKKSYVLFMPCTEKAATSQPADCMFNDEVDLSDPDYLALFQSRLQGSDWQLTQRFSTPTFTNAKIDQQFNFSDQHYYFYKCYACNHQQIPEFNRKFVRLPGLPDSLENLADFEPEWLDKYGISYSSATMHCEKCGALADYGNSSLRSWVAKYPEKRDYRGYRISPFATSQLGAPYVFKRLIEYKQQDFIRGWYNTVLGEAYEGGDERLRKTEIEACFTPVMLEPPVEIGATYFLGGDVGTLCHIVVLRVGLNQLPEVVLFEVVKGKDYAPRVQALIEKYNIVAGLGDRYPEQTQAESLREATYNIFLPAAYENNKSPNSYEEKQDEYGGLSYINLQRTWSLDKLVQAVRNREISFSGYGIYKETIITHLQDMIRVEEPEKVAKWVKQNGTDHFFHALNYGYAAYYHYYRANQRESSGSVILLGGLNCKPFRKSATLYGGRQR